MHYGKKIQKREPSGRPHFKSFEQRCVHDADVLEILRVLPDIRRFDSMYLAFTAFVQEYQIEETAKIASGSDSAIALESHLEQVQRDLSSIIAKWNEFITLTESHALKMHQNIPRVLLTK